MRTEGEFLEAIDCRFPYDDPERAHVLMDEACAISANAAFMVVHELARRPWSSRVGEDVCLALLERLDARFSHPLKHEVLAVARQMIRRVPVPAATCCAVMQNVAAHPGQFSALGVAAFACADDGVDEVDRLYRDIVDGWQRSVPP